MSLKNLIIDDALTFDDVLLIPQESNILPENVSLKTKITKNIILKIPLISSPMDTVTESKMAITIANLGGLGVIHKNLTIKNQAKEITLVKQASVKDINIASVDRNGKLLVAAAIGISKDRDERLEALIEAGANAIIIDTAHGHSKNVLDAIKDVKKKYSKVEIIAGNIATASGAKALIDVGVDCIKIGIGSGSICTTRIIAGIGVPQLTAVYDAAKIARENKVYSISDGGIKYSGDIVKALAVGADAVMAGSLFAGTDETPGDIIEFNGKKYKSYRGMGSVAAMEMGSKDRYFQGSIETTSKLVPEGIEGAKEYRGSVVNIIYQIIGGIKSGMGYIGSEDLKTLRKKAKFVKITGQGLIESHVHDVVIMREAPNYKK